MESPPINLSNCSHKDISGVRAPELPNDKALTLPKGRKTSRDLRPKRPGLDRVSSMIWSRLLVFKAEMILSLHAHGRFHREWRLFQLFQLTQSFGAIGEICALQVPMSGT